MPRRFRRRSPQRVRASRPGCLQLLRSSSLRCRVGTSCLALRRGALPTTMASADFCIPIASPLDDTSPGQACRPPRVRRVTFTPLARCIYTTQFRMTDAVRANYAASTLAGPCASYAVRVPRAGASHSASFRLHLAVKTLAVPVGVPGHLGSPGDFHPHVTSRFGFPPRLKAPVHGASRHAWRT